MRVLLTSPRAPATLEIARAFASEGHEVHVCDSLRFGCGSLSRRTHSHYTSGPRSGPKQYMEQLNRLIGRLNIEILIPTCEEIFYIAHFRKELDCKILVDDFELLDSLHNKWTFSQFGSNQFGRVPETTLLQSAAELQAFSESSEEYVFKPVYSRFASETLICPPKELLDKVNPSSNRHWVAQRHIAGVEYSTYSIAQAGELVAHSTYRSSYRAGLGSGIYFVPAPNETIESYVKSLVRDCNLTGQIGFDCIVDPQNQLWVIEANPRATSGVHLFDQPEVLVNALLNRATEGIGMPVSSPPRMLTAAVAIWGLAQALRKFKLIRFLKDLAQAKDVLFVASDPLPLFALPLTVGEISLRAIREFKSLQQASTHDIEWNGQKL